MPVLRIDHVDIPMSADELAASGIETEHIILGHSSPLFREKAA